MSQASTPMVFAVASGKGGVGKTFFSVHLALLARMMKPRVLLIDGDLGLSNIEVAMGLHPRHHLGDVLSGTKSLAEAVTVQPKTGLHILAGGAGVRELADLTPERRHTITALLEESFREYDVVVIDAGVIRLLVLEGLGLTSALDGRDCLRAVNGRLSAPRLLARSSIRGVLPWSTAHDLQLAYPVDPSCLGGGWDEVIQSCSTFSS